MTNPTLIDQARLREALEPFAKLAAPKTYADAPGETGPSQLDMIEGKDGTGELYLGTHFGTVHEITVWRDDFERAYETLAALTETAASPGSGAVVDQIPDEALRRIADSMDVTACRENIRDALSALTPPSKEGDE
jgi:hypothetical protein